MKEIYFIRHGQTNENSLGIQFIYDFVIYKL
jgi:hypothetical protein